MNVIKYIFAALFSVVAICACNNDDDGVEAQIVPPRDRGEQQVADDAQLQEYLKTHFYTLENVDLNGDDVIDYQTVKLDTLLADSGMPSIMDAGQLLITKEITRENVKHKLYILNVNAGRVDEQKPTFADSTLVTYRGELLYNEDQAFDSAVNPVWFDLTRVVDGFREAVVDFGVAASINENTDGTFTATDFGHLIVFMPSGLGYFANPPQNSSIPTYAPLIFNIQLYKVNQSDHDGDGIPSYLEDLDGDRLLLQDAGDNTDGDTSPNYLDGDDDNDGTLTQDELTVTIIEDDDITLPDEIIFYDDDKDGVPNHLDPDDKDQKNG